MHLFSHQILFNSIYASLLKFLAIISQQNFAHGTAAVQLWHVQNFLAIHCIKIWTRANWKFPVNINYDGWKYLLSNGPQINLLNREISLQGVEKIILVESMKRMVNSSPPSTAYMCQWIGSALVQIIACRLFGAKPLSKPILGYCQLDP